MKKRLISIAILVTLFTTLFSVSAFAEEYTNYYDGVTLTVYCDYVQSGTHYITISPGENFTYLYVDLTDSYKSVILKATAYFYDENGYLVDSCSYYDDDVNGGWTNECWALEDDSSYYMDQYSEYASSYMDIEVRVYDAPMIYWSPSDEYALDYTSYTASYYFTYESNYTQDNVCYKNASIVQVDNWESDIWDYFYSTVDAYGGVTNYIRIRDLAAILDGTNAQFDVSWYPDYGVCLYPNSPYDSRNGTEFNAPFSGNQYYKVNWKNTYVDLNPNYLDSIILYDNYGGGHTYYKLRDIGRVCGFNVSWINDQIVINTNQTYSDYA